MAYKALYNKYRPSTFEEVAGQQAIVRTLKNAIDNGKIAHAYLFCGPRGTGKTSMARLFAKALNCEEGIGHQCNHCSNCLELASGTHPDVIEIDAASNNGVEQVRELIDQVHYSPIKGRFKIYIIDEVHMMSQGAFNALLKTLEEPPEHVIFILATTEPHKVIPTILSRCQRYDFSKIDDKDLKEKLAWVLQQENVTYENAGLDQIVSLADGGMRDALSILDQILAYSGNDFKEKDILSVFGLTSMIEKVDLLKRIASNDVAKVLSKFDQFINAGVDIKRLSLNLLDILKDIIIFARTKQSSILSVINESDAKALSECISAKQASKMIDILLKCQGDFKIVSNIRSLFELTLIQLCALFGEQEIEEKPAKQPQNPIPQPIEQPLKPAHFEPVPPNRPEPKPDLKPAPAEVPVKRAEPEETKPEPKPAPAKASTPTLGSYDPSSGKPYTGSVAPSFLLDDEATFSNPAPEEPKEVEEKPIAKPVETKKEPEPKQPEPIVQEEKVEPLVTKGIHHYSLATDGTPIVIDDDTILNIMVLGPKYKEQRKALYDQWNRIDGLRLDPKFCDLASLLADARPFCLCEEALLINFNFPHLKEKANLYENQAGISELIEAMIGRKVFVYALDRNDSNRCQKHYVNLAQLGKLPKPEDVTLTLPKGGK